MCTFVEKTVKCYFPLHSLSIKHHWYHLIFQFPLCLASIRVDTVSVVLFVSPDWQGTPAWTLHPHAEHPLATIWSGFPHFQPPWQLGMSVHQQVHTDREKCVYRGRLCQSVLMDFSSWVVFFSKDKSIQWFHNSICCRQSVLELVHIYTDIFSTQLCRRFFSCASV